ncbi:MAG: sigma-E factor negative regulatory protein [Pseudomonadota bacterium]
MNDDTHAKHDPGREQLSAFLDDELNADEARFLLRRLDADPTLVSHLRRYAVIGEALRGNPAATATDLVGRVRRSLDGEIAQDARTAPSTPVLDSSDSQGGWAKSLVPVARVGVAAAVAAFVLVNVLPQAPAPSDQVAQTPSVDEELFPTVPEIVDEPGDGVVGVPVNAAFASYLLKHTSAVGPTVRPDFVASQRAYDHLQPSDADGADPSAPDEITTGQEGEQ